MTNEFLPKTKYVCQRKFKIDIIKFHFNEKVDLAFCRPLSVPKSWYPMGKPGVPFASVCHYRMGRADFTHYHCGMVRLVRAAA